MPTSDPQDKSPQIAQQVMHRIGEGGLRPIPAVYMVLFEYYAGSHTEVVQEINALQKEGKVLTTSFCEHLFERFFSNKGEKQAIDATMRKVQLTMAEISEIVRGAGVAHKEYNKNLIRHSDSLSSATELEQVKDLVADLMKNTQQMVDENRKLEQKLDDSSHKMEKMREDIQSLRMEALTDTLTGIPNRKAFDSELKKNASDSLDKNRPLCLIMIDIDHFKIFNDTYGHQVGDQVLRLVSHTLMEGLKPTEMLARYGGEEFAVIVPSMKLSEAEKLADRLRQRVATKDIVNQTKNEKLGRLSISLGVAQLHPGEPLSQFVERSDKALYKAKAAGRNTVVASEFDKSKVAAVNRDIVIDTIS